MPHTCSCGLHEPVVRASKGTCANGAAEVLLRPELTPEVLEEMKATRRQIHKNPELSFFEKETAALVAARLRALPGYTVSEGVAPGHGVVALLHGGAGEGPTIALRADMDALPIQELAAHDGRKDEFCSENAGVMHACGHDGHVLLYIRAIQQHKPWAARLAAL